MSQVITNMDKQESHMLLQLISLHNLDAPTASKTQRVYRQLRKVHLSLPIHLKLEQVMRTAILIAEQSQSVYTLTGQKTKTFCLALNQMVRTKVNLKSSPALIRAYVSALKSLPEQTKQDLLITADQLGFGQSFIQKFERAMQYFSFETVAGQDEGYKCAFKSMAWVFFLLLAHRHQLKGVQADYLLISVLYLMTRHAFDYLRPKSTPKAVSSKEVITTILQRLFQIFLIQDVSRFKQIGDLVDETLQELIASQQIASHPQHLNFLSPVLLVANYKRIDSLYLSEKLPHEIDHRLFLQDRYSTLTPARRPHNRHPFLAPKNYSSHKMLDFEGEAMREVVEKKREVQLKLPSNVKVSPSYLKTPLICAYQQSPGSSLLHYMTREAKSVRKPYLLENRNEILEIIQKHLAAYVNVPQTLKERAQLCYGYFTSLASKHLASLDLGEEETNYLHCGMLALSLIFSMIPFTSPENKVEETRQQLLVVSKDVEIHGYFLWRAAAFILQEGDRLPLLMKETLKVVERISTQQMFFTQDILEQVYIVANNQPSSKLQELHRYVQKIMTDIETQTVKLVTALSLEHSEQLQNQIFRVIKYILLEFPQLAQGKTLSQILLSCSYLVLRLKKSPIRFNDLILVYQQTNQMNTNEVKNMSQYVSHEGDMMDIISFYNTVLMPTLKPHLPLLSHKYFAFLHTTFNKDIHNNIERPSFSRTIRTAEPQERPRPEYLRQMVKNKPTTLHGEQNQTLKQKQRDDTEGQKRNETTVRQRPMMSLMNCLHTEKQRVPKQQFR